MAPLLPGPGSAHATQVHQEAEAKPSSWWGDWLEVDSTCRPGRGRRIVSGQHRSTLDSSSGQHGWQITRFSPTREPSAARGRDSLCSLSVSAWLWPRQLEATPGNSAKSSALGRRHSTHSVALTTKPALKRPSVESTAEGSATRRVSFSDITDTREVEFSKEKFSAPAESNLKPSDEAFAAFRVKPQFEETELPPSLRAHGSSARYHSAGHHQHHALATASPAPAIDEGLPSGSSMAYVPLRTRASEVQGPAQSSRTVLLRKVPHYKIRIRRAFSRARMLHAHHHTHHLHNGPVVLGETPVVAPTIVHIKVPDVAASPALAAPSPTLAEPASTPLTAAALQRHEALMQQPSGDSSSDAMALAGVPASLSLGMSMHQGAIFGVVSTVAVEAMQLSLAQKRGSAAAQTANLASAAARGAAVGAAGGGMALLLGPVAPTAIFVGYGLIREWSAQGYAWLQNQTTGALALSRAVEVSGSAAGGVACAMAAATLLSGFSGVAIAAAAGCSGFAGSLGGREVAAVCFQHLSTDFPPAAKRCKSRSSKSSKSRRRRSSTQLVPLEPWMLEAYSILGVDPQCSNAELKRAYRQAVLRSQSGDMPTSHFDDVIQAMERIRATRQTPLQLDLVPDIWLEPAQMTQREEHGEHFKQGYDRSHFAGFIGGMVAQQAAMSSV